MSRDLIVRAWKNPQFRASLTPEQRALVPAHPAGAELNEDELRGVVGGMIAAQTGFFCTMAIPDCLMTAYIAC